MTFSPRRFRLPTSSLAALAAAALAAVALACLPAAPAQARRTHVSVGLGDQSPSMFTAASFRALKLRKARTFTRWDAIRVPFELARLDQWIRAARTAHVRPYVHISTSDLRPKKGKLISRRQYRRDVGRLV